METALALVKIALCFLVGGMILYRVPSKIKESREKNDELKNIGEGKEKERSYRQTIICALAISAGLIFASSHGILYIVEGSSTLVEQIHKA